MSKSNRSFARWIDKDKHLRFLIKEIASNYDTPVVIYSKKVIKERVAGLQKALPEPARLVYSVKANPNPIIIQILLELGLYFEVASAGELSHLIKSAVPPSKILFGGPAKRNEGITQAIDSDILAFNVESSTEIARIWEYSSK